MIPRIRLSSPIISYLYRVVDLCTIALAAYLASQLRFNGQDTPTIYYHQLVLFTCLIFLLISNRLYRSWRGIEFLKSVFAVTWIWMLTCALILLGIFFTKTGPDFSRIWLAIWYALAYFGLLLVRGSLAIGLRYIRSHDFNVKRVGLIGAGPLANEIGNKIATNRSSGFVLTRHIESENLNSINLLAIEPLDEIWIALPIDKTNQLASILKELNNSAASIKFIPDMFTFRLINHGISEVLGMPMLDLNISPFIGSNLLIKSLQDFLLSILILVLVSPLFLMTIIGIKLTSPGPIFYRQQRVGLNGTPFNMLKFRSMPINTEKTGVQWGGSDSKVTHPFGAFIRKYNIDELPQFFNVLKGEMSIVGPRPERVEFIHDFAQKIPNYMKKHLVKAGITGWAQVHGLRGDTDLRKRIEYDLYYIENWSLKLDLTIILKTIIDTVTPKVNRKP